MQHAAIFPECNHAQLPLEADLKFRLLDISEQEIQQSIALRLTQMVNMRRGVTVDEQDLLLGRRVSTHDRMITIGIGSSVSSTPRCS